MSYDQKTAQIKDPVEKLRRDITLLSDEQKTQIFNESIGDLPDAHKPALAAQLPKPVDKASDKAIDGIEDHEKAKHADFVATRLTPEQQQKVGKRVADMLAESKRNVDQKKQTDAAVSAGAKTGANREPVANSDRHRAE